MPETGVQKMQTCYIDIKSRAIVDLIEYKDHYLVTRINVAMQSRGLGVGRKLMQQVLQDADNLGVTLSIGIGPSDGLDYGQLEAWYRRLGFCWRGVGFLMIREPR